MTDLNQEEWQTKIAADENAIILDVRTEIEVEEGYLPNAVHLDIYDAGAFMAGIQDMDKDAPYYVYCRAGSRSAQACMIMESIGFKNTYNLVGGYSEWTGETTI